MSKRSLPLSQVYRLLEPGPVVLLTTARRGKPSVMTMSWHVMMEFEPPLVGCVISDRNYSFDAPVFVGERLTRVEINGDVHVAQRIVDGLVRVIGQPAIQVDVGAFVIELDRRCVIRNRVFVMVQTIVGTSARVIGFHEAWIEPDRFIARPDRKLFLIAV